MATYLGGQSRVSHSRRVMKIQRHAAILRVVRERRIESQDELRDALASEGFVVTQATLSRDIRELGLAKLADPHGGAYYTHPHRAAVRPDLGHVLPTLLVSVDGVGPFLVLKTASGSAGAVTEALDQAGWTEMIGTIAGDDTVLVITRSVRHRQAVATRSRRWSARSSGHVPCSVFRRPLRFDCRLPEGGVRLFLRPIRRENPVRCLALNASFEPLTMVPVRRALRLVIEGKAEIVESDAGDVVRSERLTLPKPAIIRLVKFVHVPRRFRRQVTNTFLFARDGYRCQYCHRGQAELRHRECLTRDHLIPLSRGGDNEWSQRGDRVQHLQHAEGQPPARGVRHASRCTRRASRTSCTSPGRSAGCRSPRPSTSSCSTARRRCGRWAEPSGSCRGLTGSASGPRTLAFRPRAAGSAAPPAGAGTASPRGPAHRPGSSAAL